MNRNVQFLISHGIFKQAVFGTLVDDLPTLCQRYKQTIAIVSLTASKLSSKAFVVNSKQKI